LLRGSTDREAKSHFRGLHGWNAKPYCYKGSEKKTGLSNRWTWLECRVFLSNL